jgi:predicted DNA-binding protein (MmcQ/YjbR family)
MAKKRLSTVPVDTVATPLERAEADLRALALSHPETKEEFPWHHRAFKVKGKTFLFLFRGEDFLSLSVKLPDSCRVALLQTFAKPTEYGLGKSGWVTARFSPEDDLPMALLADWLDESFRAIAPKKLAALAEAGLRSVELSQAPVKKRASRASGQKRKKAAS